MKTKVSELGVEKSKPSELKSRKGRLIISYSHKRTFNDSMTGRTRMLPKDHINNRGYNKYLKPSGKVDITMAMKNMKQIVFVMG